MKHLYDSLRGCAKEEEVKAEFCKFFKMKIFALRGIGHYTEHVLFEFKYDSNFRNPENQAAFIKQTDLLTPNGVRERGGAQFTATIASDATSCAPPVEVLRLAHDALRATFLPQIDPLGFLNRDVEFFT